MKKNQLGNSSIYVSELGLGCMSLQAANEEEGVRIIHEAIDKGITFFDTADLYEYGLNESLVGKALKEKRSDVILATKVGNRPNENKDGWSWDPSKAYIKKAVKASLQRLKTEYIDLYQLHGGTIEDPIDDTIEAFEELKHEGYIREYGISSIRPNVIRQYVQKSNIVSVMSQYSILDRRPEEEILDLLHENNISVIARGPVAKGMLTKEWREKVKGNYLDYSQEDIKVLLEKMEGSGENITSLALAYATHHPAVATAIPGARTLEQLRDVVEAIQNNHVSNQLVFIKEWSKPSKYEAHR
ncbi:aldo/keto reductase [Bacillus alkalicellulosilyticus]|uniref:aldo/keto reductase n=1 Tax=Alkalihalobacterium alkalicellulosilyticum TaxID=1912214 RepID=UPI000996DC69|nr:aldo/keto reductase [Bacillus alkalicellulosilyticus]